MYNIVSSTAIAALATLSWCATTVASPASYANLLQNLRIDSVKVESSHGEIYSKAIIGFEVECSENLEDVQLRTTITAEGKIKIYAAALVKQHKGSDYGCLAFQHMTKEVDLGLGVYSRADLSIFALPTRPMRLAPTAMSGFLTKNVRVYKTEPLCPQGAMCITDGTTVTFAVEKRCGQQSGPFVAVLNEDGDQANLMVTAAIFNDRRQMTIRCQIPTTTELHSVSFPMHFWASPEEVPMNILASLDR